MLDVKAVKQYAPFIKIYVKSVEIRSLDMTLTGKDGKQETFTKDMLVEIFKAAGIEVINAQA